MGDQPNHSYQEIQAAWETNKTFIGQLPNTDSVYCPIALPDENLTAQVQKSILETAAALLFPTGVYCVEIVVGENGAVPPAFLIAQQKTYLQ